MGNAERLLAEIWLALAADPASGPADGSVAHPAAVRFTGPTRVLAAAYDVSALAAASVAAATLAVAELGARRARTEVPDVIIDRVSAAAAFRSEALLRPVGWRLADPWDPIAGDYRSADGWIRLHTNYRAHRDAALAALGLGGAGAPGRSGGSTGSDRNAVAAAVRDRSGEELQEAVVAAGGCAAVLHTPGGWAAHPHGRFAVRQPPVALAPASGEVQDIRVPSSAVLPAQLGTGLPPLAGLRVLDLTRVIAGPVATRTLAAWGADVLRIDPPGFEEVPALLPETTMGKLRTALDLRNPADRAVFEGLLREADVVVHGLRPGALAVLGYPQERLAELSRGGVSAALSAYGWTGPWAGRRGFDSLVQLSTGIAAARDPAGGAAGAPAGRAAGADGRPVPLPAQVLDHASGYLLAAGVCRALTRRLSGEPPIAVRCSLVGTAALLQRYSDPGPGPGDAPDTGGLGVPGDPGPQFTALLRRRDTAWGPVDAVPQPGVIHGAEPRWQLPAGPLGAHPPSWA